MTGEHADFADRLRCCGATVKETEPMSAHTTFRIGGPADFFIGVPDAEVLCRVQTLCRKNGVPLTVIGNGSNLLVSDEGIDGVVAHLLPTAAVVDGCRITCGGGYSMKQLCRDARENGLTGLEFAYGIPGSVGGGIYMNAGAYGGQISDVLEKVTVVSEDNMRERPAAELALSYRHSTLMQTGEIVTAATFLLKKDDPAAIGDRMEAFMRRRREKQPLEYPSAGSFFKRPEGYFAGALIEKNGLKDFAVGDARISPKHAGFVINTGKATCRDVLALCRHVQETVRKSDGVFLEREVKFIGRNGAE